VRAAWLRQHHVGAALAHRPLRRIGCVPIEPSRQFAPGQRANSRSGKPDDVVVASRPFDHGHVGQQGADRAEIDLRTHRQQAFAAPCSPGVEEEACLRPDEAAGRICRE